MHLVNWLVFNLTCLLFEAYYRIKVLSIVASLISLSLLPFILKLFVLCIIRLISFLINWLWFHLHQHLAIFALFLVFLRLSIFSWRFLESSVHGRYWRLSIILKLFLGFVQLSIAIRCVLILSYLGLLTIVFELKRLNT